MSELPAGWVRTTLGEVVDYATAPKIQPDMILEDSWVLELEDIEKGSSKIIQRLTYADRKSKSTKTQFDSGDILYGKLRPYLNKVVIADSPGYCTTEIIPIKPTSYVDGRYLFYTLKRPEFIDYVKEVSHGLNMPRLGTSQAKNSPFILPPINEQIRIANKLATTLAKVDAIKTRLDKIPTILKRFRQSVLAAATSGRLTEEWRLGNKSDEWMTRVLSEIATSVSDGDHQAPPRSESGIPFLVISNVKKGKIDFDNVSRWVPQDYVDNLKSIRVPAINDILYTVTGSYGIPVVVDTNEQFCFQRHIAIVKPNHEIIDYRYLYIALAAPVVMQQANDTATGTAQKTVSLTSLRSFKIPFPGMGEQKEIVRRVEDLTALSEIIEKQYQTAKNRVDKLTLSILNKAFRGALVPQDPNDEPAEMLLARIRAEREVTMKKSKSKRVSTKSVKKKDGLKVSSKPKMKSKKLKENALYFSGVHVDELLKTVGDNFGVNVFTVHQLLDDTNWGYEELKESLFELIKGNQETKLKPKLKMHWDGEYQLRFVGKS